MPFAAAFPRLASDMRHKESLRTVRTAGIPPRWRIGSAVNARKAREAQGATQMLLAWEPCLAGSNQRHRYEDWGRRKASHPGLQQYLR